MLCVDHAYLFRYTPTTGRRTDLHTDAGCLSFTMALSSPTTDYEGGGTWFRGLPGPNVQQPEDEEGSVGGGTDTNINTIRVDGNNGVLSMETGQVTIRPGGVQHCGYPVTRGTRYIIGGFCIHRKRPEYVRMLLSPPSTSSDDDTDDNDDDDDIDNRMSPQALIEAAICLNPACTAGYNLLAHHHLQQGNPILAQEILEYCLQHVDGQSSEVAYALASLHVTAQRYDAAWRCISICLTVDPQDVEAIMMSATIAAHRGDHDTERRYYQTIIEIPDVKPSIKASAYCNLGVLHQGEELELEYYRQSLKHQPKTFAATYSLASALASRKQWSEAIALFRQAIVDLNEDDDNHNDSPTATTRRQNRRQALQSLYTATMQCIKEQQDVSPTITSREGMMQQFQEIMGVENFQELQSLAK